VFNTTHQSTKGEVRGQTVWSEGLRPPCAPFSARALSLSNGAMTGKIQQKMGVFFPLKSRGGLRNSAEKGRRGRILSAVETAC